jgi:hypothetical protein
VAIPALALTFMLDLATGQVDYQHAQPWKYVPLFLTFTTDWWFLAEDAFSNMPYSRAFGSSSRSGFSGRRCTPSDASLVRAWSSCWRCLASVR